MVAASVWIQPGAVVAGLVEGVALDALGKSRRTARWTGFEGG